MEFAKKSPERISARHHRLSEIIFTETSAEIADESFDKKSEHQNETGYCSVHHSDAHP